MTQPPYEPVPPDPGTPEPGHGSGSERPQDTPHDPARSFPTYGRPAEPSQYGQAGGQPQYGQ
ncbi:MAG TPA: flagellar basal body-associated protein FliL, partial [Kribbella sp.]